MTRSRGAVPLARNGPKTTFVTGTDPLAKHDGENKTARTATRRNRHTARPRLVQRGADAPFRTPDQLKAMARVAHLTRIYADQHPGQLPNNELGIRYVRYMCRTMAYFAPIEERQRWLKRYAPWMTADQRTRIIGMSAYWYSPQSLGQHLEIYDEDRERMKVWTIEAVDVTPEQRERINLEKHRKRQERYRRKRGVTPREQYVASVKGPEPWKARNMSRRTYYRRGLHRGTGSVPAFSYLESISHTPSATMSQTEKPVLPILPDGWPYCSHHVVCRDDAMHTVLPTPSNEHSVDEH